MTPLRYGRKHWEDCICTECVASYNLHQGGWPCVCPDCDATRYYLEKQKERINAVASVNFCERHRCQTMGKSTAMGVLLLQTAPDRETKRLEICPGCVGELVTWLTGEPATERPKAYHEPWTPPAAPATTAEDLVDVLQATLDGVRAALDSRPAIEAAPTSTGETR